MAIDKKAHAAYLFLLALFALVRQQVASAQGSKPIALHPNNPHYFIFRGVPTVLITSGEHYGAAINPDFDYVRYLDALRSKGLNLTRVFAGSYCEDAKSIPWAGDQNTLAPRPSRFLAPWARSSTPGYANGGNKFDLDNWDMAYFRRLKDFCCEADKRGIIVEVVLFCVMYHDAPLIQWDSCPLNVRNNVNGVGRIASNEFNTPSDSTLVARQDAMVQKVVAELKEFDNVYYEICNEPYFSGASLQVTNQWQDHLIAKLVEAEAIFPSRHLIAQNVANGTAEIAEPNPAVSVFNFHYAFPPAAVASNYRLNKAIVFDETHDGTLAKDRRKEAWAFILAGGAGYDNLDWSFATDDPTGEAKVVQPGGKYDGEEVRSQLSILKTFINTFEFVHMSPDNSVAHALNGDGTVYALVDPGKAYAVYVLGGNQITLVLDVPAGQYQAEWLSPRTGGTEKKERLNHKGGSLLLVSPPYSEDIALRFVTKRPKR
jgi:hypothetical protein